MIVSLLFLLILTMIGVASMQTTTLEEKMAGNMRDRDVALQAAESGIRDGEAFIEAVASTAAFAGSNGLYGEYQDAPDPFATATWTSNATSRAGTPLEGIGTAPRFFARYTGTVAVDSSSLRVKGYGQGTPGDVATFEITARGTGVAGGTTAATESMVRTFYGRRF
ncbi:MAG: pilus assembly protein PilX [Gammaproteobacteria bacterium]|nr:pilus assembly protein PilX [Gammaproteobacteria bacterium]